MQDFRQLRVWHVAQELCVEVVRLLPEQRSRKVPGLRNQAIRAAMSIASNIAEGCSRATPTEFLRFVEIALGSLNELEGHTLLARKTGLVTNENHERVQRTIDGLRRMILALRRALLHRAGSREDEQRTATPNPPPNAFSELTALAPPKYPAPPP